MNVKKKKGRGIYKKHKENGIRKIMIKKEQEIEKQAGRQAGRQADKQASRQAGRREEEGNER